MAHLGPVIGYPNFWRCWISHPGNWL